jgi:hypothetical protein
MRKVDGEEPILRTDRGAKIGPSEERGEVSESGCRKCEQQKSAVEALGRLAPSEPYKRLDTRVWVRWKGC